ncbi:LysR family transcriptional regulator [Novosphingobium sp.]|uniref:LysR family transcriptional regulator n=1 Tax=Novosphingobium sp. TaxID=1874826 RepID=UPI00262E0F69|nr:LysR family transcriptional regulator [Novosphingobium sp.]
MRYKGLDLNLLVAFDALMTTRSVSRSAERLNLSQPAMSAALSRLREYFGDELLQLQGKRMHPTPFADELMPQVRESLLGLEVMLSRSPHFDPATSQRSFKVVTSDYVFASLIVPLVAQLAEEAPGIRIDCELPQPGTVQELEEGKIDITITPEYVIGGNHLSYILYHEPQVVVGWSGNPAIANGTITEEAFFAAGHVAVVLGGGKTLSYADRTLDLMGRTRTIEATVAIFTAVPWLIEGTNRLSVMHSRLAAQLKGRFAITSAPVPFEIPAMKQMLSYHPGRKDDAGLAWLRGRIEAIAHKGELVNA